MGEKKEKQGTREGKQQGEQNGGKKDQEGRKGEREGERKKEGNCKGKKRERLHSAGLRDTGDLGLGPGLLVYNYSISFTSLYQRNLPRWTHHSPVTPPTAARDILLGFSSPSGTLHQITGPNIGVPSTKKDLRHYK